MDNNEFAEIECELTPEMERLIIEKFGLEIEMLQGEQVLLPDGRTEFKFTCGQEKGEAIRDFILALIAKDMHAREASN